MNCVMPKIEEKNRKEQIRNQMFRENVKISPVKTKLEHGQIRWLGHIMRRYNNRFIKQIYDAKEIGKKKRGRPRKTLVEEHYSDIIQRQKVHEFQN